MLIDYYFSVLSDWAYLGAERFGRLAERFGATVVHKPILLDQVYARTGGILLQQRSLQRQAYRVTELKRWRQRLGVPINIHPKYYPTDSSLASCAIIASDWIQGDTGDFSRRVLRAIWAEERDISDQEVLADLAADAGMDPDRLLRVARSPDASSQLAAHTHQAVEAGVFGSPFYHCAGQLFWGQDRLDFVEELLAQGPPS